MGVFFGIKEEGEGRRSWLEGREGVVEEECDLGKGQFEQRDG